jgi:hypothetical protein
MNPAPLHRPLRPALRATLLASSVSTLAVATALALAAIPTRSQASGFQLNSLQNLSQQDLQNLAGDLGAALSYKPLAPAATLGPLGFDLGVAVEGTSLMNMASVQKAVSNATPFSTLPVPTIRAIKGLPFNIDIGAEYARVPLSNINLYGAEVKWAALPGNAVLPAVALRADITRMNGVPQLGFESYGVDLSVSKGFVFVTPYAGVGTVRSRTATDGLPLQQVNLTQSKAFIGVDFNLGLVNLVVEADRTGAISSYGAKFGLRF